MLGIYDYTVVLTYVSLMVSIGGMMLSVNGHLNLAVLCLAISGLCDMFDGKIAQANQKLTLSLMDLVLRSRTEQCSVPEMSLQKVV